MVTKNDLFLQPITDFFSKTNLERIKKDFVDSYFDEHSQTYNALISKDGIYDNEHFTSYNEVYIERFKVELENAKLYLITTMVAGPKNKAKLIHYIQNSLKSFLSNNSDYLKEIPEIRAEIEGFSRFFFREFSIKLSLKTERFKPTSVFGFKKEKYSIRTLKSLYLLSISSEIFDEDEVSEEAFIEVLTDDNSNAELHFSCQTPIMVAYLELISIFFRRLDKKHIIVSNRFFTTNGTALTSANFDTARNRYKGNSKSIIALEAIIEFTEKQVHR